MLKFINPQIVFIMEKKLDARSMEKVCRKCGFMNGINGQVKGSRGGFSLAWNGICLVSIRIFSRKIILMSLYMEVIII